MYQVVARSKHQNRRALTAVGVVVALISTLFLVGVPQAQAQGPALDVTCDNDLDIGDALVIAQYTVGTRTDSGGCPLTSPSTQINAAAADVNNDGVVDVADALLVAQCSVGIPNQLCSNGVTPPPAPPLDLRGVNLASAEFGSDRIGVRGIDYAYPTAEGIDFFLDAGMTSIRLPFRWERLQRSLGAEFDADEFAALDAVVTHITEQGATVILDPHNYARYFGNTIGSNEVPVQAFADFWAELADRYKDNDLVIFGLMNEPHTISQDDWISAANAAIASIRDTGATNLILVPGNYYTGAWSWFEPNGDRSNAVAILDIVDPGDNLVIEVHQYFDADSSGTSSTCISPTIGSERLEDFTEWLRLTGYEGFLGEFGAAVNEQCLAALDDTLDHLDANDDVWIGWTYWAAGPLWPQSYIFEVEPTNGVSDDPQLPILLDHLEGG